MKTKIVSNQELNRTEGGSPSHAFPVTRLAITSLLTLFLISFASATLTEDLFSNDCTSLNINIQETTSQVNFEFNPEGYDWDEFSVEYEIDNETKLTLNNLYLSSTLNAIEFKIETIDGQVEFTEFNIEEGSTLQAIIDNVLTMTNESFSVSDLNNNLTLVNSFIELDNDEEYMSFEKKGNNYIYDLDSGYENAEIEEIINEASQVFYISDILSDLGIENIYDLNFSIQLEGLEIPQTNGNYEISLIVKDGNEIYTKEVNVELENIKELPPAPKKKSSGGSSHKHKEPEDYYDFVLKNESENKTKEPIDVTPEETPEEKDKRQKRAILGTITFFVLCFTFIILVIVYLVKFHRIRKKEKEQKIFGVLK